MKTSLILCAVLLIQSAALAAGGPLDDKGPAYFTDRYGPAETSRTVNQNSFLVPGKGTEMVKGQFSVRTFRQDKLRVEAVFFLPSLSPAEITLKLGHAWTDEQIDAALAAYGGRWQLEKRNFGTTVWLAPDGSRAIRILNSLVFQSRAAVDLAESARAEREAKKKAVPKF